ncbi:MAG: GTP 3',8-cyclase MoaA [Candidatus Wallbacteria bacterium]|nr:GTP 3',8-cyclase MoaA [Candidatus Wallbacteria bacterium]
MKVLDSHDRPMRSLRLSVTDRCNLRCQYCMPEENYVWLPRADILHFEEISTLVDVFAGLGVDKVRLTGGEPLARRELPKLVEMLARKPALADLALTTNGILLAAQAGDLKRAGLGRLTVSLDTLDPARFRDLSKRDVHSQVLEGIDAALAVGFQGLKIDTVVMQGVNDDELIALVEFARSKRAEVRFIEYMDVGGATGWSMERVVTRVEMLQRLARHYGKLEPVEEQSSAPAARYRLPDGATFGIISSTTQPFCSTCDRSRVTADGVYYLCLYARQGFDLRGLLRSGASATEIAETIASLWRARADRGAEQRLELRQRSALARPGELRQDPHVEMHTRGG